MDFGTAITIAFDSKLVFFATEKAEQKNSEQLPRLSTKRDHNVQTST